MIRFLWNSVLTDCNYEHELKTISIEMFNSSYELNKKCEDIVNPGVVFFTIGGFPRLFALTLQLIRC